MHFFLNISDLESQVEILKLSIGYPCFVRYANHEGSKKHRDNVSRLKAELAEEEELLEGLGLGSNSHIGDQEEKIDENATPKTK